MVTLILRRWFARSLGDTGAGPQRTVDAARPETDQTDRNQQRTVGNGEPPQPQKRSMN
jgi:hypothetical protein